MIAVQRHAARSIGGLTPRRSPMYGSSPRRSNAGIDKLHRIGSRIKELEISLLLVEVVSGRDEGAARDEERAWIGHPIARSACCEGRCRRGDAAISETG